MVKSPTPMHQNPGMTWMTEKHWLSVLCRYNPIFIGVCSLFAAGFVDALALHPWNLYAWNPMSSKVSFHWSSLVPWLVGKMDRDSFGFILMRDLFIAWLRRACWPSVALLGCWGWGRGCGADETFLCPGGILWGERCLFKGGQQGDNTRTAGKALEI